MPIEYVEKGRVILADHQNRIIDQVNENEADIALVAVTLVQHGEEIDEIRDAGGGGGVGTVVIQEMIDESVDTHVNAPLPHPAYDDLPSMKLIFENGLI
jgi:hypothetical protein